MTGREQMRDDSPRVPTADAGRAPASGDEAHGADVSAHENGSIGSRGDVDTVMHRRSFFGGVLREAGRAGIAAGFVCGFLALRRSSVAPAGTRGDLGIVRPPGALDESDFLASCIRCTRCADACEAQCIVLFGPEGESLQATPHIVPSDKGCTLCLACGASCPTGALAVVEHKEDVRMGVAVVDERLCVSHNGTGVCGACHTACPLRNRAITQDFRNAPIVHPEHCVGCGLCEEVCIVRERRAIRVVSKRRVPGTAWRGVEA